MAMVNSQKAWECWLIKQNWVLGSGHGAILSEDSMIEKMFIEPEERGIHLRYRMPRPCLTINPSGNSPNVFPVHEGGVSFCARAKAMLKEHSIDYEIVLGKEVTNRSLRAVTGNATTVPKYLLMAKLAVPRR